MRDISNDVECKYFLCKPKITCMVKCFFKLAAKCKGQDNKISREF